MPVSTPDVFKRLPRKENAPMEDPFELGSVPHHMDEFVGWLARQRNDLEAPALQLFPLIGEALSELRAQVGCCLARMSGSGATCFGMFADDADALSAAEEIGQRFPEWWVAASTGPQS